MIIMTETIIVNYTYTEIYALNIKQMTPEKKLKDIETKSRPSIFDTGPVYTKYNIQTENLQVGDVTKPIIK